MHFFDPTVDWPRELIQSEIPDLLYLKANDPLNLSIRLHFPNGANHLGLTSPWIEYRSLDSAQSVAMLFIDYQLMQRDPSVEREIQALLQTLQAQDVEIGRYRKVQTTFKREDGFVGPEAFIWSWAFRPLAPPHLRSCLTIFESWCTSTPVLQSQRQATTYRLLSAGQDTRQAPHAPAALILYHLDGPKDVVELPKFSQEMLYDHSVVEKTVLGLSPAVHFNDLPGTMWHSPVNLMHSGPM